MARRKYIAPQVSDERWGVMTPISRSALPARSPASRTAGRTITPPDLRFLGADDGIRTRDPHLGKVVLYQLSHVRTPCGALKV
jgi:hypothetical protein